MDALLRDRTLRLLGVELRATPHVDLEEHEPEEVDESDDPEDEEEDEEEDGVAEDEDPAQVRERALVLLGVELRARSNPAPGRQVITPSGAKWYGLPIGATITPGLRRLTVKQQQVVAGLPAAERTKYEDARLKGSTHTQALAAAKGTPAPRVSAAPKLPAGTTKVASNVAGTTGVTQTVVTPPAVFGVPSWMVPTQTLEIELNGTKIGKLERFSYGWSATSAAGNPVSSGRTKTSAMQALVQRHQARQLVKTGVPGVTLRNSFAVFSSAPGAVSLDVDLNGVDVGAIHTSGPPSAGTGWTAFPPTGAAYGLQQNPASGRTFLTKDEAIQGLIDAHTAHALGPGVSTRPFVGGPFPGKSASLTVHVAGTHVGAVHQDLSTGDWAAEPIGPARGFHSPPPANATRAQAIQSVVDAHRAYLASQTTPAAGLPPTRFTIRKSTSTQLGDYTVSAKGPNGTEDIGEVAKDSFGRWNAFPNTHLGIPTGSKGDLQGGPFRTRKDAVDALGAAYVAANPAASPQSPARSPQVDPQVKAAQDVLYGLDPKGKTASRQLQVYGGLSKAQYDTLDTNEQSTLLGDLSFIATTSKGPNASRAQKLIDRFTPAGTPSGSIPKQAITLPPNVVSAQTRVSDPAGTPSLLKMLPSGQRGANGDGWTRTTTGGSGPWGQYGAAGLLLRHVDGQGVERFLMIERGAGISDPYKWQFPGGAKDEREDFYQGAAREVIEELGFKPTDLDQARVHGTHSNEAPNVMVKGMHGGQVPWAYVSIAATVPTQLKADLSTAHARAETNDAKWMTRAEIEALDRQGKLLKPLAGGALQTNVMSLFPTAGPARPAPRTSRPARLTGNPSAPAPAVAHKVHRASSLVATKADQDKLRADVSANRKTYRGKTADERLSVLASMQGFDGAPTVLPKADIDRLLKSGEYIEAWRGVSGSWRAGSKTAARINEDMRSGVAWFGTGVFGNGYYLATDKSVARQYSDGTKNSIARVLIPKSAVTRKPPQIKPLADATSSSNRTIYNGHRQGNGLGTLRDPGRYMVAAGIDGMEIPHDVQISWASARHIASPGHPAYNWVNRTILIVQEADP